MEILAYLKATIGPLATVLPSSAQTALFLFIPCHEHSLDKLQETVEMINFTAYPADRAVLGKSQLICE